MSANGRPPSVDTQWLARLREEVVDPALPIIDAHHHLWEVTGYRYLLEDLLGLRCRIKPPTCAFE